MNNGSFVSATKQALADLESAMPGVSVSVGVGGENYSIAGPQPDGACDGSVSAATDDEPLSRYGSFDGNSLRQAICSALPASSTDEDRYSINGVCLERRGTDPTMPIVRALATNGCWLASYEFSGLSIEIGFRLLIPLCYARMVLKLIGKDTEVVSITYDETLASVKIDGGAELRFPLQRGLVFPDTHSIWPTGEARRVDHINLAPTIMAGLSRAFTAADAPDMIFEFRGLTVGVVVISDTVPQMRAVVMPMPTTADKEEDRQLGLWKESPSKDLESEGTIGDETS